MSRLSKSTYTSSVAVLALVSMSPAYAQESEQPGEYDGPEIIVTAQLRSENVQDISVSLATFSGDELNELGVTDTAGLTAVTSGVLVSNILGGSVPTITIRGQGVGAASFFANQPLCGRQC